MEHTHPGCRDDPSMVMAVTDRARFARAQRFDGRRRPSGGGGAERQRYSRVVVLMAMSPARRHLGRACSGLVSMIGSPSRRRPKYLERVRAGALVRPHVIRSGGAAGDLDRHARRLRVVAGLGRRARRRLRVGPEHRPVRDHGRPCDLHGGRASMAGWRVVLSPLPARGPVRDPDDRDPVPTHDPAAPRRVRIPAGHPLVARADRHRWSGGDPLASQPAGLDVGPRLHGRPDHFRVPRLRQPW